MPERLIRLQQGGTGKDARVVNQHVDAAKARHDLRRHALMILGHPRVKRQGHRGSTKGQSHVIALLVEIGDHEPRTFRRAPLYNPPPNPSRPADHHHHLVGQLALIPGHADPRFTISSINLMGS